VANHEVDQQEELEYEVRTPNNQNKSFTIITNNQPLHLTNEIPLIKLVRKVSVFLPGWCKWSELFHSLIITWHSQQKINK